MEWWDELNRWERWIVLAIAVTVVAVILMIFFLPVVEIFI